MLLSYGKQLMLYFGVAILSLEIRRFTEVNRDKKVKHSPKRMRFGLNGQKVG